jgi:3-oxoadipate enol-lactonase
MRSEVAVVEQLVRGSVRVSVSGAGPAIWLFHSLLADAGSFAPLAARLSSTHRVAVPDLPGFGGSAPAGPGLDAVADRMAEAVRELGGGPAIILGNGYGSFVALTLALRHPALARRLVLAGTGAAFTDPGRAAFRAMADAASARGLAAVADVAMRRLFSAEFQAANPALAEERRESFLAMDPAVFTGACAALAALDLRDQVRALRMPTLVVVGERDEATPPVMARELAALLPNAELAELPGLAHVPQLQDPGLFAEAIKGFI